MNIVTPYAKMMDVPDQEAGIVLLRKIEWCGRISHRSEEAQIDYSWEKFLRNVVLSHGDWSITEHASVTVDATVDRGVSHEWVRHRLGSYTQESTRFVNYQKKLPARFIQPSDLPDDCHALWHQTIASCEAGYATLIAMGVTPQIARSLFPNALSSRLVVTYNLRNWRHFFLMRTTRESHPQIREVAIPLLQEFQRKIPLLYEDIEPGARQADNLMKPR